MDDKVSKLKAIAELRDSGILDQREFEEQKAKILSEPSSSQAPYPNYGTTPTMAGMRKGSGPIPTERRSGWIFWLMYFGIAIAGSFVSSAMYFEAIDSGECYEDYYYGGVYCEPDYDLMFLADLVSFGSSIVSFGIYLYWTYNMYKEFNSFLGQEVFNPFLAACVPIFNIYAFYVYCDYLNKQARLRGYNNFIDPTLTCCLVFALGIGLPIYQGKLNEFWDIVAYAHSPNTSSNF